MRKSLSDYLYYHEDNPSIDIYCGDCLEIMPLLPKVDLVVTDPPYGIGADKMTLGNGKNVIFRGDENWDSKPGNIQPILDMKVNSIIWGGNYFNVPPSRCWLVWDKGTGDNDFADCELAWTNKDSVVKKFFKSWVGANAKDRGQHHRVHPTQKSTSVIKWSIQMFESTLLLDPFLGSGTTLVACKELKRNGIGIEINEKYCEIAKKRLLNTQVPFL